MIIIGRVIEDLTGQSFGNLKVIGIDTEKHKGAKRYWHCICQVCGYETSTATQELNKIKKRNSIGCKECFYHRDLLNKKIGRLTVIKYNGSVNGNRTWLCLCECGNYKILNTGDLSRKDPTLSCGCLKKEILINRNIESAKRNGDSTNPEYQRLYGIWNGMINRCENPNHHSFEHYGKRNITVCEEWHDWETFKNWALHNGYSEDLSIDRINTYGNYEPDNCRWATAIEQANNTTRNIIIPYDNRTQTLAQWCRELQLDYDKTRRAIVDLNKLPEEVFTAT